MSGGPGGGMNLNQLMKQAQQMQAEMMKAQEQLKDEVVDASAGGGMVKVKMSGDMRLLELTIDPEAIDPDDAEVLADMVTAAVNEALRAPRRSPASAWAAYRGSAGPAVGRGFPGCRRLATRIARRPRLRWRPRYRHDDAARADQSPDRRTREAPRVGQRTAQRLAFHILRSDEQEAVGLADAIREVKERVTLCEVCFNLAEGPRCRICADEGRDGSVICVVEEPGDVIPIERTHDTASSITCSAARCRRSTASTPRTSRSRS